MVNVKESASSPTALLPIYWSATLMGLLCAGLQQCCQPALSSAWAGTEKDSLPFSWLRLDFLYTSFLPCLLHPPALPLPSRPRGGAHWGPWLLGSKSVQWFLAHFVIANAWNSGMCPKQWIAVLHVVAMQLVAPWYDPSLLTGQCIFVSPWCDALRLTGRKTSRIYL